jgi:membrane-associated phospholipid phosphatase
LLQLHYLAAAAGACAVAGYAAWAERRRHRRRDLDRVGWVPWPLVLIVAIIGAALCVAGAIGRLG